MEHHPTNEPDEPGSLPDHLARSAARQAGAIALCHKARGGWVAWTWRDWNAEVKRVAAALATRGFRPGDVVAIAAHPSPQALAVTLAAQTLGGAAMWLDPEFTQRPSIRGPAVEKIRFGFARDEAALAQLRARLGLGEPWTLGLHTADHGSPDDAAAAVRTYAAAAAEGDTFEESPRWARASDVAFWIEGDGLNRAPSVLTHGTLADAGLAWLAAAGPVSAGVAFVAEAPTTAAVAAFFAGWLVGGFPLGLPEDPTTADTDRQELQPCIVAATGGAFGKFARRVTDSLPPPDTLSRRALDAGLSSRARWGGWVVRRRLREVLGLRRAEVALVLGDPSPPATASLFAALRILLRTLSAAASATSTSQALAIEDARSAAAISAPAAPARMRAPAPAGDLA